MRTPRGYVSGWGFEEMCLQLGGWARFDVVGRRWRGALSAVVVARWCLGGEGEEMRDGEGKWKPAGERDGEREGLKRLGVGRGCVCGWGCGAGRGVRGPPESGLGLYGVAALVIGGSLELRGPEWVIGDYESVVRIA